MSFTDPATVGDPTTGRTEVHGWGDAVNGSLNYLRGAKAGCRVTSSAGTATGTDTVLPWATETFDPDDFHDNVTNNSRLTVPSGKAGLYHVYSTVRGASNLFTLYIVVNATTRIVEQSSQASGSVVSTCGLETTWIMAVGDYFEVWMTGGSSRDTGVASSFGCQWLASGN
jgi:hypothetical protein